MSPPQDQDPDNPEVNQSAIRNPQSAIRRVALISAPRRQLPFPARPARLYSPSEFFTLALAHATRTAARTYILSPHHGLLRPDGPVIAPYREAFDRWTPAQRRTWAERILAALLPHLQPGDCCVFYAGRAYREDLQYRLRALGYTIEVPLQGLDPDAQIDRLRELAGASE
jgi:hypothetical protein